MTRFKSKTFCGETDAFRVRSSMHSYKRCFGFSVAKTRAPPGLAVGVRGSGVGRRGRNVEAGQKKRVRGRVCAEGGKGVEWGGTHQ